MTENVKNIGAWIESENCFAVMEQLRKLGVLSRADMEKAMQMTRIEWLNFMKEKTGIPPDANNENGGFYMKKKRKKKKAQVSDLKKVLNPIITIEEHLGESLYCIVDFSIPGDSEIRRIISKRLASGNITAVTYIGKVGPDQICTSKRSTMEMRDISQGKSWQSAKFIESLYKARGATIEIRNYSGKTIREAAGMMQRLGNTKVWVSDSQDQTNF